LIDWLMKLHIGRVYNVKLIHDAAIMIDSFS